MKNKGLGCAFLAALVLLGLSLVLNLALLGRDSTPIAAASHARGKRFDETAIRPGSGAAKIANIRLDGIISGNVEGRLGDSMVEDLEIALRQAGEDEKVKAVVLSVDSPGGEVTAADTIYRATTALRAKKPVVVHMGSLAASGGYYVACGGSHLIASDTTLTGSIGVIIQALNYRELFGKIGLEAVVFKSGQFKDMLNGAREMTPEEKALVQDLVMQIYSKFLGVVANERKLPEQQLLSTIADGRILSGADALENKLVDAVGTLDAAFDKARELAKAPDAPVVRYEAPFGIGRLFRMLGQSRSRIELHLPIPPEVRLERGKLYLLPAFYGI